MIPYDDLVAALANWRAKQGLPGSTLSAAPQATAATPSAPASKSGPKTAPPGAPPGRSPSASSGSMAAARHGHATVDDHLDVDEAALLEEASYGDDEFGAAFASATGHDEATSIGGAPTNDATVDDPLPARGGRGGGRGGNKKSSDW